MTTDVKPHIVKASEMQPTWHVIDAAGKSLGRLSTEIAIILQGKHKPSYAPYLKSGDFVIVINSAKVSVNPRQREKKVYYWHTSYPGGLRQRSLEDMLRRNPNRVIEYAVKGMLPKSRLGRQMLKRLRVYRSESHPHQAQVTVRSREQQEEAREAPGASKKRAPVKKSTSKVKTDTTKTPAPSTGTEETEES